MECDSLKTELDEYLSSATIPEDDDALLFWGVAIVIVFQFYRSLHVAIYRLQHQVVQLSDCFQLQGKCFDLTVVG